MKAIKVIFKSSYSLRGLFLSFPFHPSLRSVCQAHSSTLSSISPFGRNRVIFNLYIQFSHNIFYSSFQFPYNIQFSSSLHSLRSFRFVALSFRDTSEFSLRSTSSDPSLGSFRFLQSLTPSLRSVVRSFSSLQVTTILSFVPPLTSFKVSLSLESSFRVSVGE